MQSEITTTPPISAHLYILFKIKSIHPPLIYRDPQRVPFPISFPFYFYLILIYNRKDTSFIFVNVYLYTLMYIVVH